MRVGQLATRNPKGNQINCGRLFFILEILEIKEGIQHLALPCSIQKETKTEEVVKGRQYDQGHSHLIKQLLVSFHLFQGFPIKARPLHQLP